MKKDFISKDYKWFVRAEYIEENKAYKFQTEEKRARNHFLNSKLREKGKEQTFCYDILRKDDFETRFTPLTDEIKKYLNENNLTIKHL